MRSLATPSEAAELLDDPAAPREDVVRALEDIALSNRLLGGCHAVIAAAGDLVRVAARDGAAPVVVLDVGAGGADASEALASWARAQGLPARVIAADSSQHAVDVAARRAADGLHVLRADAFRLPFRDGGVHVVHAGQFLHHVPRARQAGMLARLAAVASVGCAVTDLVRSRWAHRGIRLFGAATGRGAFFRHDGPLSVARGFTMEEAWRLARESGVPGMRVQRLPFFRLAWIATRSSALRTG